MLVFTYAFDDVLNNVQVKSLYRANYHVQNGPEINLDDTVTTTFEDKAILTNFLKKGAGLIAQAISGYAHAIYDVDGITPLQAIEFTPEIAADNTETPPILYTGATVIFRVNMPPDFNNQSITSLDQNIMDYLENYVLYRLGKDKGHDFETYQDDYKTALSQILFLINQRIRPVTRHKRTF